MTKIRSKKLNRFSLIAATTLLVNVLLFTALPNLMKSDFRKADLESIQTVDFLREPPERELPEEKKEPEKPPEEKPRTVPEKVVQPVPKTVERLELETPELEMEILPEIKLGVPIAAPTEPVLERTVAAPAAPTFKSSYESSELDSIPVATAKTKPEYPYRARRLNLEGEVDVRFLVTKNGRVEKVSVLRSRPEDTFEESVLAALSSWRFEPGKVRGQPVNSWVTTTIVFKMDQL